MGLWQCCVCENINTDMVLILKRKELVFVGVRYYIPDYTNIINEFYWQTEDIVPDIPRVHQFLEYWQKNIDAIIKEVEVSTSSKQKYTNAHFYKVLN